MQPLTIITGILLGSSFSIAVSLSVVLLIFAILSDDYPRLAAEFRPLAISTALFVLMTTACALSFIGLLKQKIWRWPAQASMWICLLGIAFYYWPR